MYDKKLEKNEEARNKKMSRSGWTPLNWNELKDLALHSEFLTYANQGVSLNITSFHQPTLIYRSDASESGVTLLRPRVREPCLLHLGNQQQSLIVKFHHYPFLFPGTNFINSSSLSN
jgi:hypothetical protein